MLVWAIQLPGFQIDSGFLFQRKELAAPRVKEEKNYERKKKVE